MSTITRPAPYATPGSLTTPVALLDSRAAVAPFVARVSLALLMFPHGAQHALGWFGGYGFRGTLGWMTGTLGFPAPAAALAITVELLAPFALLLGFGSRLAALGLVGLMLGAISTHVANGFFMNWFGALKAGSEGFEYHLFAIALAAVVVIDGGGALSVDRRLARAVRSER
ncbi:DoxX family protein (plasmid) [Gemmatirosa kalamazoonensis]|uniref:DoxX family protein n=1 Tax=Gemmatirosa kalamazoonensis TaxID=861299 RepID=W0RSV6_9BACT|nr:DoxX family protein [Gemmatirosa kalamazoonensis]AHG92663.1 DoxX family protein [Gemmatirosa kalamazoonensis]